MAREDRERYLLLLREQAKRAGQRRFYELFPDLDTVSPSGATIHARAKYPKHVEFMAAGGRYRERCFMAGNRLGKTETGAYEMSCHLTGLYPRWWEGKRFRGPTRAWAAGKSNETTRDIVQTKLLGETTGAGGQGKSVSGTGLIPGWLIGKPSWKQGVPNMVDTVRVRHISGGHSVLGLKSYQQGRGSFEGTAQDAVWLDEEPPLDIYGECLIRTATTDGIIYITFTPLAGVSETVLQFMPAAMRPGV